MWNSRKKIDHMLSTAVVATDATADTISGKVEEVKRVDLAQ